MPSFLWMCCQEHGHKIHVKQAVSCKLVCSPLFFHCAAGTTSAISASIFFAIRKWKAEATVPMRASRCPSENSVRARLLLEPDGHYNM